MDKKGSSFSTIVAVIGAVLIALGFAWLIAQNWHFFSSTIKIIILVGLTGASFTAGFLLQHHDYEKIGRALYVLGNLLYILSVFLIAQIFSLGPSTQGVANLLLISMIGVFFATYYFRSYTSLIIAFALFLVWMNFQFFALNGTGHGGDPSIAAYLLLNLAAGALFQGASWVHEKWRHAFATLYNWWSMFYFLVFFYILSFQALIPYIWEAPLKFASSDTIFVMVIAVLALAAFGFGASTAKDGGWKKKGIIIAIGLLILFIFASKFAYVKQVPTQPDSTSGYCYEKSCNDHMTEESCGLGQNCAWQNGFCDYERVPREYKFCALKFDSSGQPKCEPGCELKITPLKADESEVRCQANCALNLDKAGCVAFSDCRWVGNACQAGSGSEYKESYCYEQKTASSCQENTACKWEVSYYGHTDEISGRMWIFWILVNVFFIGAILAVIGLGSYERNPAIINLGIFFFVLDIVSRYIGFMMDFWGYTSLSVIFIIGGLILIGGGYLIEKWRRQLVSEARK